MRAFLLATCVSSVAAQALNVGSDGSDGAFVFVPDTPGGSTMTIDLSLAASGLDAQGQPITWQTPSPIAGRGVYDPVAWAVVFKYASVDVPVNATVRFRNNVTRAPVVWLSQGTITVRGTLSLNPPAIGTAWTEPGPGGFRGALSAPSPSGGATPGFGPGGGGTGPLYPNFQHGNYASAAGAYLVNPYGSPAVFPLIGGSGASVPASTAGLYVGGAGGGAVLLAANQRVELKSTASVSAIGNYGSYPNYYPAGSGGAIRIVSNEFVRESGASVSATGNGAGQGYVRIEANSFQGSTATTPPASIGVPSMLLPDSTTPIVSVVSVTIGGQTRAVPADPQASFSPPQSDVTFTSSGSATITIQARNVAPGRTCEVRVANVYGSVTTYTSSPLSGTLALSTASASVPLAVGIYDVQVRVVL